MPAAPQNPLWVGSHLHPVSQARVAAPQEQPEGTGCPAGSLAAHHLGGEGWLRALFYVLFIPPRETEEFSVQESRALAPLPPAT